MSTSPKRPPTPPTEPPLFAPDPAKTPEENIQLFWDHLHSVHAEYTDLLRRGVKALTPLPEVTARKTALRTQFHVEIAQHLDADAANPEGA